MYLSPTKNDTHKLWNAAKYIIDDGRKVTRSLDLASNNMDLPIHLLRGKKTKYLI